mmetsp:Transcript_41214/g.86049  ORF Transcript_41214/g.86049 Transcript_41214/m.86049 type:complete len:87 (+) Transcript_41214:1028-1288(+)
MFNSSFAIKFCCPQQECIAYLLFFCVEHLVICIHSCLCETKMKCRFSALGFTLFPDAAWFLFLDFSCFALLLKSSPHNLYGGHPCS